MGDAGAPNEREGCGERWAACPPVGSPSKRGDHFSETRSEKETSVITTGVTHRIGPCPR